MNRESKFDEKRKHEPKERVFTDDQKTRNWKRDCSDYADCLQFGVLSPNSYWNTLLAQNKAKIEK